MTAVNDPPVLNGTNDNKATIQEDSVKTIPRSQLIGNFSDIDSGSLQLGDIFPAVNGMVSLNGSNVIFTPNTNFSGIASFRYMVFDNGGDLAYDTFEINVTPVNDAPALKSNPKNTGSTDEDTEFAINDLNLNFIDPDVGDILTFSVSNPENGTVEISSEGTVLFKPTPNFVGTASFIYAVKDKAGELATDKFIITVKAVNDKPVLKPDAQLTSGTTEEDQAFNLVADTLKANFTDPDTGDTLTVASVTNPKNGTVTLVDGKITFTPTKDFVGDAFFDYTVKDSHGETAMATFKITVTEANDKPILKPDAPLTSGTTEEDQAFSLVADTLKTNFADPDTGDTLTVASVTNPKNGTVILVNGKITFTPTKDFVGDAFFDYTVKDSHGETATATFKVSVSDTDDPLIIKGNNQKITDGDQSSSTQDGTSFGELQINQTKEQTFTIDNPNSTAITVNKLELRETTSSNAQNAWLEKLFAIANLNAAGAGDFALLTASPITIPSLGSASFTIQFKPTALGLRNTDLVLSFSNNTSYRFRVDGTGLAKDSPPVLAKPIAPVTVNENAPNTELDLAGTFTDPENKPIVLSIVSNTNSALVAATLNGTKLILAYAPNQSGTATITIRATADGETVETSFTVTVTPNPSTAIPIFSPVGLLILLLGLVWFGRRAGNK